MENRTRSLDQFFEQQIASMIAEDAAGGAAPKKGTTALAVNCVQEHDNLWEHEVVFDRIDGRLRSSIGGGVFSSSASRCQRTGLPNGWAIWLCTQDRAFKAGAPLAYHLFSAPYWRPAMQAQAVRVGAHLVTWGSWLVDRGTVLAIAPAVGPRAATPEELHQLTLRFPAIPAAAVICSTAPDPWRRHLWLGFQASEFRHRGLQAHHLDAGAAIRSRSPAAGIGSR